MMFSTEAQEIFITTSVGVAQLHDDDSIETVISRADAALYRAKDDGRNQVQSNI